jgi:hypothetical protein
MSPTGLLPDPVLPADMFSAPHAEWRNPMPASRTMSTLGALAILFASVGYARAHMVMLDGGQCETCIQSRIVNYRDTRDQAAGYCGRIAMCEGAGSPAVPQPAARPAAVPAPGAVACFASDSDNKGVTATERSFRGLIRQTYEREAAQGSDGAVTISFQSFKIASPRRWSSSDGFNFSSDQSKPIYDLRVLFTTCTDYRTAIQTRQLDRNFQCFTAPTGGASCQVAGSTGGMAPEKSHYLPKQ